MYKTLLKWTPAQPLRKPDNIISSPPKPVFKPLYLHEPTEDINFLLTNEYMRKWFKEKEVYDKNTYIREQIIREECKIKRRFIQRMVTYRKPSKNQFIEDYVQRKFGQNKMKNLKDQEQNQKRMKYKPVCRKTEADRRESMKAKSKSKSMEPKTSKILKQNEESEESDNDFEIVMCPLNCEQSS